MRTDGALTRSTGRRFAPASEPAAACALLQEGGALGLGPHCRAQLGGRRARRKVEGLRVQPRSPNFHKLEVLRVGILSGIDGMGLHVLRIVGESHLHLEVYQHVREPLQHTLHEAFR